MRMGVGLAVLMISTGLSSVAAAQSLSTIGDWRDLGHDADLTYAWDLGAQRSIPSGWIVRVMQAPLRPQGATDYSILEVRISCAARTYVIERGQAFNADGRPLEAVQTASEGDGGADAMRPVDGTPAGVFLPFVCGEAEQPAGQTRGEAALMARAARGYVLSGAAEWERQGRPARTAPDPE